MCLPPSQLPGPETLETHHGLSASSGTHSSPPFPRLLSRGKPTFPALCSSSLSEVAGMGFARSGQTGSCPSLGLPPLVLASPLLCLPALALHRALTPVPLVPACSLSISPSPLSLPCSVSLCLCLPVPATRWLTAAPSGGVKIELAAEELWRVRAGSLGWRCPAPRVGRLLGEKLGELWGHVRPAPGGD